MACIYIHGGDPGWAAVLGDRIGREVRTGYPAAPEADDLVFLGLRGDAAAQAELPGRNAFAACRALKSSTRARVFLITESGDAITPEVARFCLADGCVVATDDGGLDLGIVERTLAAPVGRAPVAAALEHLEREMADETERTESAIQRILVADRANHLIDQLTDPATGLFAGPFANFKLEEEFKRAQRFHQSLALLLVDIGIDNEDLHGPGAELGLAEVSAILLNECRDIDVLARFTETCFMCLLPGTGSAGAVALATRLLGQMGEREYSGGLRLRPHAGLATMPASGVRHRSDFLARAERCLEEAAAGQGDDRLRVSCE